MQNLTYIYNLRPVKKINMDQIGLDESDYLYKAQSSIKNAGIGLRTSIKIFKDEIICYYSGEVISNRKAKKRAKKNRDLYFINLLDGRILDSMNTECFAKYANDSKGPGKTKSTNNAKITIDNESRVCLVAKRKIKKNEEILCSYGKAYWKKHAKNK